MTNPNQNNPLTSMNIPIQNPSLDPELNPNALNAYQAELAKLSQLTKQAELDSLNSTEGSVEGSAEEMMLEFQADPIGFIESVVDASAEKHLSTLRDETELRAALRAFWKKHETSREFEPYVMQALEHVIKTDDDGILGPWDELLEKALQVFQSQFKSMVKNHPSLKHQQLPQQSAHVETSQRRAMPKGAPSFTRKQIANMSSADFAKHESAIEEAMRLGRIR